MTKMRWLCLLWLAGLILLSACGGNAGGPSDRPVETMIPALAEKMAHPKFEHKDEQFEMKLNIEKTTFKVGEPIVTSASLTYIGGEESFTVWGSSSAKVGFTLTDGKEFDMVGIATMDLVPLKLIQGETVEFPFAKSGGFDSNDPDAEFWRSFYAEKDLKLPAGTYLIRAHCNFSLTEAVVDSHYHGEVYATITVTE